MFKHGKPEVSECNNYLLVFQIHILIFILINFVFFDFRLSLIFTHLLVVL